MKDREHRSGFVNGTSELTQEAGYCFKLELNDRLGTVRLPADVILPSFSFLSVFRGCKCPN